MTIQIEAAGYKDVDAIERLMRRTAEEMEHPDWFADDDRSFIENHIEREGKILIAKIEDQVLGFFILDESGEREHNLGWSLGFTKEMCQKAIHMDSIVVAKEARGLGLQRHFLAKGEELAKESGFTYCLATVHPDNIYSRRNFTAMGYEEAALVRKYGNKPRMIMKKRLEHTMNTVEALKNKIFSGELITKEEALALYEAPLEELCKAADEIRTKMCGNGFDICTIINGKSGKCSENCKYCAQSAHYHTGAQEYPLLEKEELLRQAAYNAEKGVLRYSIVTSGRALRDDEVDEMCIAIKEIKETVDIQVCVSMGLLNEEQYRRLHAAGATRVHNNLETSKRNFPNVCTTHTFEDKVEAIRAAQRAGMTVCSGGIMGMGETIEDRIDMILAIRELGIKSVPVNMLNAIPGTPYEQLPRLTVDDMRRIVAVYRFVIPDAAIRMAGGRGLMADKGAGCFTSGANAAISGDMLTTAGYTIESDLEMIHGLGYKEELREL